VAARRPQQPRARTAVVALPPRAGAARTRIRARFAPSTRSILVGLVLLGAAGAAYLAARQTSAFAISRVEVTGAPPDVRAQVQQALAPLLGRSLIGLDGSMVVGRVERLPTVVSAVYDRAFPHTLRISVVPERVVAALRQGKNTWLVSARGRVVVRLAGLADASLPRIWVPSRTPVAAGEILQATEGGAAAQALARASRFPARVRTASFAHGTLLFTLRSGLQLRLGTPADIRLKLAVARRVLPLLQPGTAYLELAVPGRPVTGTNPQVSGGG
jgi:cell division protein FtsQ